MKAGVVSVLAIPFANKLEVRVTRSFGFNERPMGVRVYSCNYSDFKRVRRLAKLAGKLNELVLIKMVVNNVSYGNALQ